MAASHDPALKENARRLMEEEGFTLTETARKVGVAKQVVHDWATAGEWRRTEVVRQVRVQQEKVITDPALDAVLQRLASLPRSQRERVYDEEAHQFACSIPLIVKQMPRNEVVAKADKVAKLFDLSRSVLGRDGAAQRLPTLSLGILSANRLPDRQDEDAVDAEVVAVQ